MKRAFLLAAALAGLVLVAALVWLFSMIRYGVSTHDPPTVVEGWLARSVRHWAVPVDLRYVKNPMPLSPEVLASGRAHWADHCASCHANDGKGESEVGQNLYPRTPDMTLQTTQSLSDGELFAIIENGIRLTGMPGWGTGTAESARGSWELVHFIRHLPSLTGEELAEMQRLNPKTAEEWEQMQAEEEFLAGEEEPPARRPHHH